jgi:hypothetical protein
MYMTPAESLYPKKISTKGTKKHEATSYSIECAGRHKKKGISLEDRTTDAPIRRLIVRSRPARIQKGVTDLMAIPGHAGEGDEACQAL